MTSKKWDQQVSLYLDTYEVGTGVDEQLLAWSKVANILYSMAYHLCFDLLTKHLVP